MLAPLLWGLLCLSGVTFELPAEIQGERLDIAADDISIEAVSRQVFLSGHALVTIGDASFSADFIALDFTDLERPTLNADGAVELVRADKVRLTGRHLTYDLGANRGRLDAVEIRVKLIGEPDFSDLVRPEERPRELIIRAEEVQKDGVAFRFRAAEFTASPATPPQWRVVADQVFLNVGDDLRLSQGDFGRVRGARLQVNDTTVLGLTKVNVGPNGLLFPRIGANGTDGLFVEQGFAFSQLDPIRFEITPRLGTGQVLTGRAWMGIGGLPFGWFDAVVSFRERQGLRLPPKKIRVSRWPELGWHFAPVSPPLLGGRLTADLTWGRYDEERFLDSYRFAARADYSRRVHRGRQSELSLEAGAFYGSYDTGDEYAWLMGGIKFRKAFGYRVYGAVGLRSHYLTGATPFLFDRIEIPTEVELAAKWRVTPHWIASTSHKIDVNQNVFRRTEYGLAFRDRQFQYGLNLVTRPQLEFQLDAQLIGF